MIRPVGSHTIPNRNGRTTLKAAGSVELINNSTCSAVLLFISQLDNYYYLFIISQKCKDLLISYQSRPCIA